MTWLKSVPCCNEQETIVHAGPATRTLACHIQLLYAYANVLRHGIGIIGWCVGFYIVIDLIDRLIALFV